MRQIIIITIEIIKKENNHLLVSGLVDGLMVENVMTM